MKRWALIAAFVAAPAMADPLDLVDYADLFAANAADVEEVSEGRSILRLGDQTLIRDATLPRGYAGIDESGVGTVGCYVTILATIESAMQACEAVLPADQATLQAEYLAQALAFYGANTVPVAPTILVEERYNALVSSQIEGARPFCSNLDLVTSLADQIFSAEGVEEIAGMLATPRLPVEFPCL